MNPWPELLDPVPEDPWPAAWFLVACSGDPEDMHPIVARTLLLEPGDLDDWLRQFGRLLEVALARGVRFEGVPAPAGPGGLLHAALSGECPYEGRLGRIVGHLQAAVRALSPGSLERHIQEARAEAASLETATERPHLRAGTASLEVRGIDEGWEDVEDEPSSPRGPQHPPLRLSLPRRWRGGFPGGRLDSRRLHRVALADTRVFRRRQIHDTPHLAVHILVDCSLSMAAADRLVDAADLAAWFVAEFERHRIQVELALHRVLQNRVSILLLKSFGARWSGRSARVLRRIRARGDNREAITLEWAVRRLLRRPARRRLLVHLTDGELGDEESDVRQALRQAARRRVEVLAVLVGATGPSLYPDAFPASPEGLTRLLRRLS